MPDCGLPLPCESTVTSDGNALTITNNGIGAAIAAVATGNVGVPDGRTIGVRGRSDARTGSGVSGESGGGIGVSGFAQTSFGVSGSSSRGTGVVGMTLAGVAADDANAGVLGSGGGNGVRGSSGNNGKAAVQGDNSGLGAGVGGTGNFGVLGTGRSIGVFGSSSSSNGTGVAAFAPLPDGLAGNFLGNVSITGTLSKGGGGFEIDHPLDPGSRYLRHSFVESPDMLNVYSGNVTTDAAGDASVTLPDYFEVLNQDLRYQLTVIGDLGQAVVAQEVRNNHFTIKTERPRTKVSWQVTGVRKDPWAVANRIAVDEEKGAEGRGRYLHPELHGQPEEARIHAMPQLLEPTAPEELRRIERQAEEFVQHHMTPGIQEEDKND